MLSTEQPNFVRHSRGVRTQRDVFSLGIHDSNALPLFLLHDVAEYAAFFLGIPFARGAQFVENSSGHKRGSAHLRIRVRTNLARQCAEILKDRNIFKAEVAL